MRRRASGCPACNAGAPPLGDVRLRYARAAAEVTPRPPLERLRTTPSSGTSIAPRVRLPRRSTQRTGRAARSSGGGHGVLVRRPCALLRYAPPSRTARRAADFGWAPARCGEQVHDRRPSSRTRRRGSLGQRGRQRRARRASARSPWPNSAWTRRPTARAARSAPCTSAVSSSASARWAARAGGRSAVAALQLLDLLARPEGEDPQVARRRRGRRR